jgi:hypothetical protein
VQRLLCTRYADLADLQFSCWRARGRQACCDACSQCLRVAYGVLAAGGRPSRMGSDLRRLLPALADWTPAPPSPDAARRALPREVVRASLHGQLARLVAETPLARVEADLGPAWLRGLDPRARRARRAGRALRERMRASGPPPLPGLRAGFLRQLDAGLRAPVGAIYAQHFAPEPEHAYAPCLERSEALAAWLTAPLAGRDARPAGPSPGAAGGDEGAVRAGERTCRVG